MIRLAMWEQKSVQTRRGVHTPSLGTCIMKAGTAPAAHTEAERHTL